MKNYWEKIKEKYRKFRAWQKQPHQVKPLSKEAHDCNTCGTHYEGNFCPRCGQSSIIGRYSFKTAFLLFLDVWGLGNRGMFRSLRDLLLRPGYMIRDYLHGMHMAYFPPFKMFFLLIAFSVLVDSGFNIKLQNSINKTKEQINSIGHINEAFDIDKAPSIQETTEKQEAKDSLDVKEKQDVQKKKVIEIDSKKKLMAKNFMAGTKQAIDWIMDHQTVFQFLWLLVLSIPLYWFFRHSPNIPDIRYSEFFVAMVYTTNMMTIITIFGGFLFPGSAFKFGFLADILSIIPLKQLSGYGYWRTFFNVIAAFILLFVAFLIIGILFALLVGVLYGFIFANTN